MYICLTRSRHFLGVNIPLIAALRQQRETDPVCVCLALRIIHADHLVHLCAGHIHEVPVLHVYKMLLPRDVNSNLQGLEKRLLLFCVPESWHSASNKIDAQ